ncbi:hypothetical protein B0H94_103209 [Salsuginibacillus halophilus]|uniref:Uncharacterized protein n=1 Tax=Salsuginibacillus halophilus TaxID=517424 RepID=A0A2P8HWI0_9BACI|nr:hypothetical protein [Salsuginibacillus halophilus]PSL50596.1 hypothetical protein B0H94_103209 [Salsuginibacillus halophilus]
MNETIHSFFQKKLEDTKAQFERTIDCKHTTFDDLYPYMSEQPQFFWYKRYVAWQELLTTVNYADELEVPWKEQFDEKQQAFIENEILDAKVLDEWYESSFPNQQSSTEM